MKRPAGEWAAGWTAAIGEAVRLGRRRRGLSAEQLSAKCAEVGYPIPRNTITNLENGRKTALPLHELVVLARALDLPPVELLYPVGRADYVEVLPGQDSQPMNAVKWFSGEWPLITHGDASPPGEREFNDLHDSTAVGLYRTYASWVGVWLADRHRLSNEHDPDYQEPLRRLVERDEDGIRRVHAACLAFGIEPMQHSLVESDEQLAKALREVIGVASLRPRMDEFNRRAAELDNEERAERRGDGGVDQEEA